MCSSGVGMVGFGFVDNFVMILAGDAIDANLGATLGISAIAAAGLGNALSDVTGHYFGDAIDRFAGVLGLEPPVLTEEQKESKSAEFCRKHGGAIGLLLGCILGMCPLMFTGILKRQALTEEEKELYESVFKPLGVEQEQFASAVKAGEWITADDGTKIVEGGRPLNEIIILCNGVTHAIKNGEQVGVYASKAADGKLGSDETDHGYIVGGTRLCEYLTEKHDVANKEEKESSKLHSKPYACDIFAVGGKVRYLKWGRDTMLDVCNENSEFERALLNIMTKELKMRTKKHKHALQVERDATMKMHDYGVILKAVLADDHVSPGEAKFVREYGNKHGITQEERLEALRQNGWTEKDWERGFRTHHRVTGLFKS